LGGPGAPDPPPASLGPFGPGARPEPRVIGPPVPGPSRGTGAGGPSTPEGCLRNRSTGSSRGFPSPAEPVLGSARSARLRPGGLGVAPRPDGPCGGPGSGGRRGPKDQTERREACWEGEKVDLGTAPREPPSRALVAPGRAAVPFPLGGREPGRHRPPRPSPAPAPRPSPVRGDVARTAGPRPTAPAPARAVGAGARRRLGRRPGVGGSLGASPPSIPNGTFAPTRPAAGRGCMDLRQGPPGPPSHGPCVGRRGRGVSPGRPEGPIPWGRGGDAPPLGRRGGSSRGPWGPTASPGGHGAPARVGRPRGPGEGSVALSLSRT